MKKQLSLLFAVLTLTCSTVTASTENISTRVVGGFDTSDGDWPWMTVVISGTNLCGGTLIDERTVMTTAHCLYDSGTVNAVDETYVIVDTYDLSDIVSTIDISQIYIHSDYDNDNVASSNDIALLRLKSSTADSGSVELASINTTTDAIAAESDVTIIGWGSTVGYEPGEEVAASYPNILQEAEIPLQTDDDCKEYAGSSYDEESMLCAGNDDGGEGACQGDSGGPLLLFNNGEWQQLGIVSWGSGCASAGNPGVYTRVATFEDWIENFISGIALHNSITFNNISVGESEVQNLIISNNSSSQALLTFNLSGSNEFSFNSTVCETIAANSSCELPFTYTPTSLNDSSASLTISSDITDANTVTTTLLAIQSTASTSSSGGGSIFFILTTPLLLLRKCFKLVNAN